MKVGLRYTDDLNPCSVRVTNISEFEKHMKKVGGHIGRSVVEIIKMKTKVQKPLMIKIIKLRLRNLDNQRERICRIMGFAVSADHRVKLKEIDKKDKYLDLSGGASGIMDKAIRVQILDETDGISHITSTLGKGMNPIILPPAMGK